jgi:hypothetical protein
MIGLALLLLFLGAVLIFFAFNPKLSFFLDEGWKFRDKTEPSELYVGANFLGRFVVGVVAVLAGIGLLVMGVAEAGAAEARTAAAAAADAAHQRCETVLLPRFNETIRWDDGVVANPDDVRALAKELGVEVDIERRADYADHDQDADTVRVNDPANPRNTKTALLYIGGPHAGSLGNPDECFSYTPEYR